MRVLLALAVLWQLCGATAVEAEVSQFSGLSLSLGRSLSAGCDFGLGYSYRNLSVADDSVVAIQGIVKTVSLKYRAELLGSPVYAGVNTTFYSGGLSGTRDWSFDDLTTSLSFEAKTLYTFGVEVGYNPPVLPRILVYAGVGLAAGNLTIGGAARYREHTVAYHTTGWAFGTVASVGIEYALSRHSHLALDVSEVFFTGDLPCNAGKCGVLQASARQRYVTVAYVLRF